MSSCRRTTTPFPPSNKTTAATGDKSMSAGQYLQEKVLVWDKGCRVDQMKECREACWIPQSPKLVSSCQSLQYIFSSFFTLLASAFLRAGGEVAIISISLRETACVKGFVGQRESAGAGGLREQYRQISRGRIICASWEAGGRVGEGVRQMEGLAV